MHLLVHESNLPSIKESLRKAHTCTQPTHRTEAAAKALGFFTYASFRSSLKTGVVPVSVDDEVYCSSLAVPTKTEGVSLFEFSRELLLAPCFARCSTNNRN